MRKPQLHAKKSLLTRAKMLLGAAVLKKAVDRTVHRDKRSRDEKLRRRAVRAAGVAAAVIGAEAVRRKAASQNSAVKSKTRALTKGAGADDEHALAVTVNCSPERLQPLPDPLAALEDKAEVTVTEAPGGRGTEIHVRLVQPPPSGIAGAIARVAGTDPRQDVRLALRQTRSLIETGEVLSPDTPPTTHSTLLGKPLELAIRRSHGEGRL
jgi:hypothetical protein